VSEPAAQLWFGRTVHRREQPFVRSFSYRIAMLDLDLDRLDQADVLSSLFSIGRGNAISFRATDHGARNPSAPLRLWAEARFAEASVDIQGGAIRLITFPRVLGYGFAPISVWLGQGPDGAVRVALYEVHNTFGETHTYIHRLNVETHHAQAAKEFFVSPFFDVSGTYRFALRIGRDRMELVVENFGADGRAHVASMVLRSRALTSVAILRWLVSIPISGLGVLIAINWQALKLWLKGARYRAKSEQRSGKTTLAIPEEYPARVQEDLRKRA
jgi:DUF1365 family protein